MIKKERLILWGTGKVASCCMKNKDFIFSENEIVMIVDNNQKNKYFWGKEISSPESIKNKEFDKIVVLANKENFNEIEHYLLSELKVEKEKIVNYYFFAKRLLIEKYKNSEEKDIQDIISYLHTNDLSVFNYDYIKKYDNMKIAVLWDCEAELFYVNHCGKRMYFSKKFDTIEKVQMYYHGLCIEQDKKSPHLYMDNIIKVRQGDVVLDIGVAEGNFSLEVIDKVSKLYLIEYDKEWIEALKWTFADYQDKVVFMENYIADYKGIGGIDKLDNLISEQVDFIKMDIEGGEFEALKGSKELMERSGNIKGAICVYHKDSAELMVRSILKESGCTCKQSTGYMWYPVGEKQLFISPVLRRGIIRFEK